MSIIFSIDSRRRDRSVTGNTPANFTITPEQVVSWNLDKKETLCSRPHHGVVGSCISSIRLINLTIPYIPEIVDAFPYLCVTFNNAPGSIGAINTISNTLPTATFVCTLDRIQTPAQAVRIDSTNNRLDFVRGIVTYAITIPPGSYTLPGLADEIEVLMNNAAATTTMTVDYGTTTPLKFSIRETAAVAAFNLLWNTGVNAATSVATVLGYDPSADDVGVPPVTHTADNYVTQWSEGGDGGRWAIYKSDMIQIIPFNTKRAVTLFRVFDPNGVTIPINDTVAPTAITPLQQVNAVFSVTPFMQDGAYDNQKANVRMVVS